MNNAQKQANIAAAKLLCRDKHTWQLAAIGAKRKRYECSSCDAVHIGISLPVAGSDCCSVDIFTNPADCLAVVKTLVEMDIVIKKQATNDYRAMHGTQISRKGKRTFEDAVAAACLQI